MLNLMDSELDVPDVGEYLYLSDQNIQSVMTRMGGDRALLLSLLSMLTVQSQVWVDECDALIRSKDYVGACRWLHTLRGTMGSLGFEGFSQQLDGIERCGRGLVDGLQDEWWMSIGDVQQSLRRVPDTVPLLIERLHASQWIETS